MTQTFTLSADLEDNSLLSAHAQMHLTLSDISLQDILAMGKLKQLTSLELDGRLGTKVEVSDLFGRCWESKGLGAEVHDGEVFFETQARQLHPNGREPSQWATVRSKGVLLASIAVLAHTSTYDDRFHVVQDRAFQELFEDLVQLRKELNIGALQSQVDVRISTSSGNPIEVEYAILTLAPDSWSVTFERRGTGEQAVIEGGSVLATLNSYEKSKSTHFASNGHVRPMLTAAVLSEIYRLKNLIDEYALDGAESELLPVTWVDSIGETFTFPDSNIAVRGGRVIFKTIDHDNQRELSSEVEMPGSELVDNL